jgi:hypothetical protein
MIDAFNIDVQHPLHAFINDPTSLLDTKTKVTAAYAIVTCCIILATFLAISTIAIAIFGRKSPASNSSVVVKN